MGSKPNTDKIIVGGFFAFLGLFALVLLGSAIYNKTQPQTEVFQDRMSVRLTLAYQKYRIDHDRWPSSDVEAAENFQSEVPDMMKRVEAAKRDWNMHVVLEEKNPPTLIVKYDKPRPRQNKHLLSPRIEKN